MDFWMLSAGYAGSLAVSSFWAGEWARRKGLNAKTWGVVGAAMGPLGVVAVGLRKSEAALCPHCKAPIRFEARYCATCRAREADQDHIQEAQSGWPQAEGALDCGVLLHHSFFEAPEPHLIVVRA